MTKLKIHLMAWGAGLALLIIATLPAGAHHSRTLQFDIQERITHEGVVTAWHWRNPHPFIFLEVATESGEPETWAIELPNTVAMTRRGWSAESVNVGDHLIVTGSPGKEGRKIMTLNSVHRAEDGWEWGGFEFGNNE